ncbi:potassium channel family protein [Alcanivorax limicola]|uniref:potassium channel family protein n=1 Tax=Alcanivorax limicola TaxID=2874102 RepID=UPI001CBB32B8|nr:NAD-binding protein [Alcanivorax limicola]
MTPMRSVFPIIMRRMRPPMIVLISAYALAVFGFTLMPGVDDQGEPWSMTFFQAFYVVSYTGSTIGFGEVPYDFSNAQRLWTMVSIYLTVFAWLYSVGTIISLIQDPEFRNALIRSRQLRSMGGLREPFYLICGYGDTGKLLARALIGRGYRIAVIDQDAGNMEQLRSQDSGIHVPAFCMDAEVPGNLIDAGLQHPWCAGVLAVTDSDHTNLKVAIAAKLLNREILVFCRADSEETANNMLSFGTDLVVNPCEDFARRLLMGMVEPDGHRVYDWLTSLPGARLPQRPEPPQGNWIICGFGDFGQAVYRVLREAGMEVTVVAEDLTMCPPGSIQGKGTEAVTLRQAGIDKASALVAGTDDDADNLSIIMTARQINARVYMVALENRLYNHGLFKLAKPELPVQTSYLTASRFMSVLSAPMLKDFLDMAAQQGNTWNQALVKRLADISGDLTPDCWSVNICERSARAVTLSLQLGETVALGNICRDPRKRKNMLDLVPLMLRRGGESFLLPGPETTLQSNDRLLFCGTGRAAALLGWSLHNRNSLRYVHTGEHRPDGWVWRTLARRRRARAKVDG